MIPNLQTNPWVIFDEVNINNTAHKCLLFMSRIIYEVFMSTSKSVDRTALSESLKYTNKWVLAHIKMRRNLAHLWLTKVCFWAKTSWHWNLEKLCQKRIRKWMEWLETFPQVMCYDIGRNIQDIDLTWIMCLDFGAK